MFYDLIVAAHLVILAEMKTPISVACRGRMKDLALPGALPFASESSGAFPIRQNPLPVLGPVRTDSAALSTLLIPLATYSSDHCEGLGSRLHAFGRRHGKGS